MWRTKVQGWLEENQRSQAWLAQRAHLNPSYLNRILKGVYEPSEKTIARLEKAMDLPLGTLASVNVQAASSKERINGHVN